MIKTINSTGRYIQVSGGSPPATYVNNYSGQMNVGNVRYNTASQQFEVYDGNSWIIIQTGYASVGLSPEAESLLDWARVQRDKQWEIEALAKEKPAVAIAVENLNKARAQLEATVTLSKETL